MAAVSVFARITASFPVFSRFAAVNSICLDVCQYKQWEENTMNDVTMSDITRAVNAFITDPGLSTHGSVFPKKEPLEDLLHPNIGSVGNNTLGSGSRQIKTWNNDQTEDVILCGKDVLLKGINSITNPGSSTLGCAFPKKEPLEDVHEDLLLYSNISSVGNNTLGSGSRQIKTWNNDQTEDVILCGKDVLPKGVNSTAILKQRSLQTTTRVREEVIFSEDSALQIAAKASNINLSKHLQTGIHKDSAVAICENTLPKVVEALNFFTFSMLPSNSGMVLGKLKNKSNELGSSTSTSNKLGSTIITRPTRPLEIQKLFFCPVNECDLKFSSKRNIDRHVNRYHKLEGFQCLKCGKRFGRINSLEQHDNIHRGIKPYTCKTCGKKFHTHQMMYEHCKSKHTEPKNKLQCEICGVVGNRSFMSKHTRRVHLKLRYHCTECKEHFRLVRYLKDHMRMHRGEEPYKCALCSKTFVQKNNLLQHLKRHSKEVKCPKCDKVFKSKDYLKGHLLQHDGIKKYCCNVCGKTFHHSHYLFTHMKSHGEKCFECEICGGKFNRKDNLKTHIMRHQATGKTNFKKR